MANPHVLTWTNPTTNTDSSPYDVAAENAGYTVQLDGAGAVSIPLAAGTSFDLATVAEFASLPSGLFDAVCF